RESARVEQRERKRIAEGERGGRGSGGRETEWTRFGVDGGVEMNVGALRERTLLIAGERDDRSPLALQMRKQQYQLVGFARVRQHDDDVVGRDHPQIAVPGFGGMHEERRRPRRSERCRELARDMPRFSDARYDDASATIENQLHRVDEWLGKPLLERGDRARLGVEHFARQRERALRIDCAIDGSVRRRGLHRADVYAACYLIA